MGGIGSGRRQPGLDYVKRDQAIVAAVEAGATLRVVSEKHGITYQRAGQICQKVGVKPLGKNPLSEADKAFIAAEFAGGVKPSRIHVPGHSTGAILSYLHQSGLRPREVGRIRPWTKAEVATLRRDYPNQTAQQIAETLGRTRNEVCGKAHRLGLCQRKLLAVQTLTIGQETLSLKAWSERVGLQVGTIRARLDRGWRPQQAVFFGRHARG